MKHITKVYVAGPMAGYVDANRVAFAKAADQLNAADVVVLNPGILPFGLEHAEYMEICRPMVKMSDKIYMLDGWEESKGATEEHELALKCGLDITYQKKQKHARKVVERVIVKEKEHRKPKQMINKKKASKVEIAECQRLIFLAL